MRFGCHVRVSPGYPATAAYAAEVGCQCMQIFAKSPRMWRGKPVDPLAAEVFAAARRELDLDPLFTHTAYLINLGTADDELWERSAEALADEILRAALLGAAGVVTHIGTRCSESTATCADRIGSGITRALDLARRTQAERGLDAPLPPLLLENSSGSGSTFGGEIGELAAALRHLDDAGVDGAGLCLDTCHAHAQGMDLSDAEGWTGVLDAVEGACGEGRLKLIHANDSMFARGSRRDRHAWIGDGTIGLGGFEAMVCEPRLDGLSVIMEMPGEEPTKDVENLARLRQLRSQCPRA